MRRVFLTALAAALLTGAFFAGRHSEIWWPGPGHSHAGAEKTGFHCPMHPQIRSDRASDCPICGMKLVPDDPPATGTTSAGAPSIYVPAEKQPWIGVRVGEASYRPLNRTLRAAGRVAVDETRITRVVSRAGGWIEKVHADFTGQRVEKHAPLVDFYSPELLASQQEYLLALKAERDLAHTEVPGLHQHTLALADAARARLQMHWGLTDTELETLSRTRQPRRISTIHSPITGYILRRNAYPQQRVEPDTELYTLADLRRVWIFAEVPEAEAAALSPEMAAVVEPVAAPGRRFPARVTYVQPEVDSETRTFRLRLEAANPDGFLKPGLFVHADFPLSSGRRLAVPEDAVLDTGRRQIVFVTEDGTHFQPRRVETGDRAGGYVEIRSGLKPGEKLAFSGVFLLDSEAQMRHPPGWENHSHD